MTCGIPYIVPTLATPLSSGTSASGCCSSIESIITLTMITIDTNIHFTISSSMKYLI